MFLKNVNVWKNRAHKLLGWQPDRFDKNQHAIPMTAGEERLAILLSGMNINEITLDSSGKIVSKNMSDIGELSCIDAFRIGTSIWDLLSIKLDNKIQDNLRDLLEDRIPVSWEFYLTECDVWLEAYAVPTPTGATMFLPDITARRRMQEELTRLARYDPLTNLANRKLFNERLESALKAGRRRTDLVVMSIDLDGFKGINDKMGHGAGDLVLQQFANRLSALVRKDDLLARLGGDEFAIIQSGPIQQSDATAMAERIIDALRVPFGIHGQKVKVEASIGVAIAPSHGADPEEIMTNVDLALYRAKADKGSSYRVFEGMGNAPPEVRQTVRLALRAAVDSDQLALVYQPIISLGHNRIAGFEALLRWQHPSLGLLSPAAFIPMAEETGLIVAIGEWVLNRACLDASLWPDDLTLAVNLSPVQLADEGLLDKVTRALAQSGLHCHRLELEVTESVVLYDGGSHLERMLELHRLGVRIALDDFGTGYSSLSCLRSFPFDRIKIDRSFVSELPHSATSSAIVRAVARLGEALGIPTTAEGIERRDQLEAARAEGCNEVQGFLFSEPVPAPEIQALLQCLSPLRSSSEVDHTFSA